MRHTLVKIVAPLTLLGMAACEDSTATNAHPVALSFSSQATTAQDNEPANDITVTVGQNSVVITKAQLVVRRLQLEKIDNSACSDADDDSQDGGDCAEIKTGPILVDLPLDATASTKLTASVPEGSYHEVKFHIHKPTSTPADQAFVTANPTFAGTSIRVEGTFNGQPFVYTSDLTSNVELEFNPPIVINADNKNVTVSVDLSTWFKVNGQVINPTSANKGGANEAAVANNIRASLRAFDDDDRNGRDD